MPDSIEKLSVSDDGFTFPVEDVLTGRGFITGKSGSGKSNTASVIVEELLDRHLPLLIVDTDGEYTGLRESYDLLHAGGSDACDRQVSAEDADQLASVALGDRVPVLLDVSTYPTEDETEAVLSNTIEALFIAEHDHRIPFLILLEEAHEFIPQRGGRGGSDLKSLLIRVAKRGRKRGIGICCLSQRPASVDKDYITQCDWFVWHRLTWKNDTDVVDRILGSGTAETVQSLGDGEAVVQTDWDESTTRVQFRRRHTDDAGATPSLEDLNRSEPDDATDRGTGSSTPASESPPSSETDDESVPDDSDRSDSTIRSDRNDGTEIRYDESPVAHSSFPAAETKPSLERRRERRETPTDAADPLWEIGAIVVYLYDSFVWYHLVAVSRLEARVAETVARLDELLVGRRYPRRPGPYERSGYRLVALLSVVSCYALVVLGMLLVM